MTLSEYIENHEKFLQEELTRIMAEDVISQTALSMINAEVHLLKGIKAAVDSGEIEKLN